MSFILSGCAFTVHDVNVGHSYDRAIERPLSEVTTASIQVGEIQDKRLGSTNPRMIFQQTNMNGQRTSGGWQAEKPVADIISDSLRDALQKAQANITDSGGSLVIEGELVDLDYQVIAGMWSGTLNSQMTVRLQLKRSADGMILWRDTLIAKDSRKAFKVDEVFRSLLDDLATQMLQDEYFRQRISAANPEE